MDGEVAKSFQRILEKQGVTFKLGAKVPAIDASGKMLKSQVEPAAGGGLDLRLQHFSGSVDRGDLGAELERHALLFQDALERLCDFAVHEIGRASCRESEWWSEGGDRYK